MQSKLFPASDRQFKDHPKFDGVRISIQVAGKDSDKVGVSFLEIAPGVDVPVHVHQGEIDSIYVLSGQAEALINGDWQAIGTGDYLFVPAGEEHGVKNTGKAPLFLFVHHSPPIF